MSNPRFRINSRGTLLAAGIVLFLLVFLLATRAQLSLAILSLIYEGYCLVAWLVGAIGLGYLIFKLLGIPDEVRHRMLTLASSAALGIGAISLIVLGLGLAGWMNRAWATGILTFGWIVLLGHLLVKQKQLRVRAWLTAPVKWPWLWLALAPLAAYVTVAAFLPPGVLWGDEPNGYDVVEYHLQVPREWFEAGKIFPMHYNVFSYMPFNVEMQYLLEMHLRSGPWAGMYTAQLMHAALCALAALAVYGLMGGGAPGAIAGGLLAATPWTGLLAPVAYSEGGELLFGALAIGWLLRAKTRREYLLAGIFGGLAAGCKYPMFPVVFVLLPLVVLVLRRRVLNLVLYGVVAVAVVSPWLIRNWVWTGNPVFPELMMTLGRAHFSDVQVERWQRANEMPDSQHQGAIGHRQALVEQVFEDRKFGWLLIPTALVAWLASMVFRRPLPIALGAMLILQTLIWVTMSHLQGRFMVIAIPISALLIAYLVSKRTAPIFAVAMLALCGLSTFTIIQKFPRILVLCPDNLDGMRPFSVSRLQDDQQLNLVGDACAFCYQIPMTRLHYKTVFDVDTTDASKSIEADWLAGMPSDAVVFKDQGELDRFSRTYWGIPPLPPKDGEMVQASASR